MPPKKRTASKAESCCVCCQPVNSAKDELLFCAGACQQWIHRYCASVSVNAYKSLKASGSHFFCYCCYQVRNKDEIAILSDTVQELKKEIALLKKSVSPQVLSAAPGPATTSRDQTARKSYATVTAPSSESATITHVPHNQFNNPDRKYNIVVYGIDECPKGLSKSDRFNYELTNVISTMSKIDSSINSQSIKDCFRLGKFIVQQKQPRPILVKFIRVTDVSSILSKCRNAFGSPIRIKPDMSPDERQRESSLLRERWRLIQSGVLRSVIKIRGSHLYVHNKLYGEYNSVTCSFEQHSSSIVLNPSSIQSSNNQPVNVSPSPCPSVSQQPLSPDTIVSRDSGPQQQSLNCNVSTDSEQTSMPISSDTSDKMPTQSPNCNASTDNEQNSRPISSDTPDRIPAQSD